jgi:hypothetical protein
MRKKKQKIKAASDTIYKRSVQDLPIGLRHCRCRPSLAVLLQTMLKPITEFPDTPQILWNGG